MSKVISKKEMFYKKMAIYNRNKRYLNPQVDHVNYELQIRRRTPQSRSFNSNSKFNSSFMNSTNALTNKLIKQIDRFKGRLSQSREKYSDESSQIFNFTNPEIVNQPVSYKSPNKVKGLSLNLGLSRKGIIQENHQPKDQRLFNNYQLNVHDLSKTVDFSKRTPRKNDFINLHLTDLNYEKYEKQHDEFFYRQTTYKCLFNYKISKDEGQRIWKTDQRKQNQPATDIDPALVKQGFEITNPYVSVKINPFFNNSGRELPPQLEMKKMKQNQNYWKQKCGDKQHYIRPNLEFSLRQQRNILKQQRLKGIKQSKKPKINKNEVCMEYYYRRKKQ